MTAFMAITMGGIGIFAVFIVVIGIWTAVSNLD
jgi:hypothetical protein